jgi:hypothetical protein
MGQFLGDFLLLALGFQEEVQGKDIAQVIALRGLEHGGQPGQGRLGFLRAAFEQREDTLVLAKEPLYQEHTRGRLPPPSLPCTQKEAQSLFENSPGQGTGPTEERVPGHVRQAVCPHAACSWSFQTGSKTQGPLPSGAA